MITKACFAETSQITHLIASQITQNYEKTQQSDTNVPTSGVDRLLLVNQTYRPEWRAKGGHEDLKLINIANGFIGLTIPPGVETISLNYAPQRRLYLQLLSWIAVSMLTSFAMWFYFRNVRFYSNPN